MVKRHNLTMQAIKYSNANGRLFSRLLVSFWIELKNYFKLNLYQQIDQCPSKL